MLMVLQRKEYLDKLIAFKDKQLIKVVTGIRRCGKSTLLEIYQNWLLEQGTEEEQIISINKSEIIDKSKICSLSKDTMDRVSLALMKQIGIMEV